MTATAIELEDCPCCEAGDWYYTGDVLVTSLSSEWVECENCTHLWEEHAP